jgi:hypothetical protein
MIQVGQVYKFFDNSVVEVQEITINPDIISNTVLLNFPTQKIRAGYYRVADLEKFSNLFRPV